MTRVVLTVGTGGVGKTTVSAALGAAAAADGWRAVVVTVDPARRLADALGATGELGSEPVRLHVHDNGGEFWATMLDPTVTFDRLVEEHAPSDEVAAEMRANRIYENLAGGLSGTQDYLAVEELHWLVNDGRFDLVVVDTPPSTTALDIVDAPARLVRLFDNRIYQLLTGRSRGALGLMSRAAQRFVATVASVVGAAIVDDAIEFFGLFEELEAGFRQRAIEVDELLRGDDCAVVVVASPRRDTVSTATRLVAALTDRGLAPEVGVINMAHPRPAGLDDAPPSIAVERLRTRVGDELEAVQPLVDSLDTTVIEVPTLPGDVHDAEGLAHVEDHLREHGLDVFGLDVAQR